MTVAVKNMSLAERLERFSIPEPNSGCLLWCGKVDRHGYGQMKWRRRTHSAHRLAWIAEHGSVDAATHILHRCDVPSCIKASHLWTGTHLDNMRDMVAKGRAVGGGNAKLTYEQVVKIRADTRLLRVMAEEYGVSDTALSDIRNGKRWTSKGAHP